MLLIYTKNTELVTRTSLVYMQTFLMNVLHVSVYCTIHALSVTKHVIELSLQLVGLSE